MPANRGVNGPHWNPKPDFYGSERPGHTAPAIDFHNAHEIAHCLIDGDPAYFAYELFENVDLYPEALEEAQLIISMRATTYKLHKQELDKANARQNTAGQSEVRQSTRYIGSLTTLKSARLTSFESNTASPRRSFG